MNFLTLSIDWEDFGQLYGKYHHNVIPAPRDGAIERQTAIILDMLDETDNKATFFILGMLASYKSDLVKKIAARGHEIALHGQSHDAMFTLNPATARRDLEDSNNLITDIIGKKVYGYRAPFFSIKKTNLYLMEILTELGILYDSSIFPVQLPRYGIADFDENDAVYMLPNGTEIVELPLTVSKYFGKKLPVSGGGYLRLMPRWLTKKVFRDLAEKNTNGMIYMHPYEFDCLPLDVSVNYPDTVPRHAIMNFANNLRWNLFRRSVPGKIKYLLEKYKFITCIERVIDVKSKGVSPKLLGCQE